MRHHSFKPHPMHFRGVRDPGLAELLRGCIRHAAELFALDPLTPFPQRTCNFGFGNGAWPLPIGALIQLWRDWAPAIARCPECRGAAFLYSLLGNEGDGVLALACTVCDALYDRPVGCQDQLVHSINRALRQTPYPILSVHPQPLAVDAGPLLEAFATLGLKAGLTGNGRTGYEQRLHWFRSRMR